jgi:uncharacterized protein
MYAREDGRLAGTGPWEKLPFFWFILFLSYRCTRRCEYCYAYNQVGDGNTAEMDDRTFSRLLEWIPEVWRANNVKVNALGFLGGEPLLRTDRIRKAMDAVYDKTDGMQGFLYTNGDLVDSVNWDDLTDIQWISVNITDTPIDELERRMRVIGERSNVIGQTVVATLDERNLGRLLDISRFGVEHGYRLRYYHNLYKGLDKAYQAELLAKLEQLCDLLEDYIARGYEVHTTFLLDTLIPLWDSESSPYLCGKRLVTVYPDGSIGPCIRDHSFKTGTIFDPDPMSRIQCAAFEYGFDKSGMPEECATCPARFACQGGCPHDKLVLRGTVSGKSVGCEVHKQIIPRLRRLGELQAERGLKGV